MQILMEAVAIELVSRILSFVPRMLILVVILGISTVRRCAVQFRRRYALHVFRMSIRVISHSCLETSGGKDYRRSYVDMTSSVLVILLCLILVVPHCPEKRRRTLVERSAYLRVLKVARAALIPDSTLFAQFLMGALGVFVGLCGIYLSVPGFTGNPIIF